ncbi:hypothetical protein [Altericroceibacterium xinjiangense]|uniref:hypothetical protein n=1 Tax=Altericroceibacterium xinjiangense TaxID=762261 RepID=UPI000F7EC0D5|nr:hypothetical protein [Altericroceibacterium xinjiangense]
MNSAVQSRPATGEHLMPPMFHWVAAEVNTFAQTVGGPVDCGPRDRHSYLANCMVLPFAHLAVSGTSCPPPFCLEEAEQIASATELDFVLLRLGLLQGVSFDAYLQRNTGWLVDYVTWFSGDGVLWLIPNEGSGLYLRMAAGGIECETRAPFLHAAKRDCAILRTLNPVSFGGRN